MEDQYGMADLRQYFGGGRPFFPAISPPPGFPSVQRSLASDNHPYYMLNFRSDHSSSIAPPGVTITTANTGGGLIAGFEMEAGGVSGRWPRQETLTLLEIRSRLDPKFKEANQKGPLWDEVSRIMCEEYGYQRSGKKCREKFENLYKYYKKTKGGKTGRQDGKHYRFYRQLEALYGDQQTSNNNNSSPSISEANFVGANFQYHFPKKSNSLLPYNNNNNQESYTSLISISNSSHFDTIITSDDDSELKLQETNTNDPKNKKIMGKRSLKAKIKDSIDVQMREMMEKQEAWMEKMMNTIEENEKERILREEQWRKQDAERIEREQKSWASEKAWIKARDAALMDAFGNLSGKELRVSPHEELVIQNLSDQNLKDNDWDENIATCYGHERSSGLMCKENWDCVSDNLIKCNKKRYDNELISEQGIDNGNLRPDYNGVNDSCFRYLDAYGRIIK